MIPSLRLAGAGARIGGSCGGDKAALRNIGRSCGGDTAAPRDEGSMRRHGISSLLDFIVECWNISRRISKETLFAFFCQTSLTRRKWQQL
jgi:hypothetical protein